MNFSKEQKKIMAYVLAINYGIYLLMRLFFYPTYECQLDEMMQAAICGVSGTRTAYILYSNVLLGWLLKSLSSVLPIVNWYFAYLCALVIAALSVICYVIVERADHKIGYTVSVVLASFVGYECYVLPGSMKTASVLGIAMLVVLADDMEAGEGKSRKRKCLIAVLAVLSSMVSFSVFWITVLTGLVGMVLYYGIRNTEHIRSWIRREQSMNWNTVKRLTVLPACILGVVILFYLVDCLSYQVSGQEDAGKYRSAMIRMYGYGMGDYEDSFAENYGIDSAEYAAIKKGSFGVTGESTWEKLDGLSREWMGISGAALNSYFKKVPLALFRYGIFYLFVVLLFLLLFSPMKEKKIFVWTELGLLLVSLFAAYLFHAWQNNWAVFVVILPLMAPLLLALKGANEKDYQYLWAYLVVLSVILYSKFSSGMVSSVSEERMAERFGNLNSGQVNMVDLNAYFKSFSAQRVYTADLLTAPGIKVSNGAYALMKGFEPAVLTSYPSGDVSYEWVYNPQGLSVWDLVFED